MDRFVAEVHGKSRRVSFSIAPELGSCNPTSLSTRSKKCPSRRRSSGTVAPSISMQVSSEMDMKNGDIHRVRGGGITSAKGFRAAGITAGFKASGLPDLAVILPSDPSSAPAVGAAVFTQSRVRAAPVELAMSNLKASNGRVAAVVINSGQANAATGTGGFEDAVLTANIASSVLGCNPEQVLVASTGVIGVRMDMNLMQKAIPKALQSALNSNDGQERQAGIDAAQAIMTTDLKRKESCFEATIQGKTVRVGGMAKGSGMIHPNMATMLGFVTCDALVDREIWQAMLKRATEKSFNMITVDGDTSTNDVLFALSNDMTGAHVTDVNSEEAAIVEHMLTRTCCELAKKIARDGEGATVLIEVQVIGASCDEDARTVARTIAGSSLVKAAVFGRDPNWGRIAAAAGRAGVTFDAGRMSIRLGDHVLVTSGEPRPFDAAAASEYLRQKASTSVEDSNYCTDADTVVIIVDLASGTGSGTAWGCDLSYKYVEINSEYTT